jgi:hypothetical protein
LLTRAPANLAGTNIEFRFNALKAGTVTLTAVNRTSHNTAVYIVEVAA